MQTTENVIKEINNLRKASSGWYSYTTALRGKPLTIKGYHTWIQRIEYDGWKESGIADISVKQFKLQLFHWLT
jgi:hypothetical protein